VTYTSERIDPLVSKYALEHAGIQRLNRLYKKETRANRWGVRYFKPLQKEEYLVNIDPVDLSLVSFARTIEETAEGAFLEQDSARAIAAGFVQKQGIDVTDMTIKKATSENRENRRDHDFEWEAGDGDPRNIGDMKYRAVVSIQGDRIAKFTTYSKVPEKWQRDRKKRTIVNTAMLGLKILLILALVILTIIRFIRQAKVGNVRWKPTILIAGAISVLFLVDRLLQIGLTKQSYPTSIDMNLFNITVVIAIAIGALAVFLGIGMATGLLSALYPHSLSILKRSFRWLYARDALITALIALLGFIGIRHLQHMLTANFPTYAFLSTLSIPVNIQSPLPLFSETVSVLMMAILITAFIGIVLFVFKDSIKKPHWMILLGLGIFIVFLPIGVRSVGEALLMSGRLLMLFIWVLFLLRVLARNNFAAYAIMPLTLIVVSTSAFYLQQDNRFLFVNGFGFVIFLLLILIWYAIPWLLKTKEE
jgi:hypothetical protein